jgi:hypothetical protein
MAVLDSEMLGQRREEGILMLVTRTYRLSVRRTARVSSDSHRYQELRDTSSLHTR